METRSFRGKWSANALITNRKTGQVNSYPATGVSFCNLKREKISVDTGNFVPGTYRINPYLVYQQSQASDPVFWTDEAADASYNYRATLQGDIGLDVVQYLLDHTVGINPNYSNFGQRALLKAYGKIGSSKANLGETLGEFRETLGLLRHPFKQLRDFLLTNNLRNLGILNRLLHFLKSGSWVEAGGTAYSGVRAARMAANTWLEYRYGLMPLIYTVKDLVELLQTQAIANFDPKKIRRRMGKVKTSNEFAISGVPNDLTYHWSGFEMEGKCVDNYTFIGIVNYRITNLPSLSENLGLSWKFVPELAWELTRLSYVVDWWFDVGSWLSRFRVQPEIAILGNTLGIRIDRNVSALAKSYVYGFKYLKQFTPRGEFASAQTKYYERRINQHLPSLPLFKLEYNSWKHVIDALALILQPVLGKIRR